MARKRKYDSETCLERAQLTKQRLLEAARKLFSKEGLLRELVHATLFGFEYQDLADQSLAHEDPIESLKMAATISRVIYESKTSKIGFILEASNLLPELKKVEEEAERIRYERQEFILQSPKDGFRTCYGSLC